MSESQPTASTSALPHSDPLALFDTWMAEARASEPNDSNAMALATATPQGRPSVRMVLLKGHGPDGFTFYTNAHSRKGEEIRANMHAALLFHWKSLRRQIRIEGPVTPVTAAEADEYFASRPRQSQIGAWASDQSRPCDGRFELEKRVAKYAAKYAIGSVPRPSHWSGFRVCPTYIEFWKDGAFRLHDRQTFTRQSPEESWTITRLFP
jgi:pyridoxamine 5'-phosphate oxidase